MSGPGKRAAARAEGRRRLLAGAAGLAAVAATILISTPGDAEVRLSATDAGASYQVSVMTWWEIPFRSVVRQRYDFSCGSAAVATLLSFHYDRPTPEREAFAAMWRAGDREAIRRVGFSMLDMKAYLDGIGYRTEGFRLTPEELGQFAQPVIVLIDLNGFKHFVVVKGVRGDRVLVGDPMLGITEYAARDFAAMWNGIALAVVEAPDARRAAFNLAGDWGPWSRAPMEDGGGMRVATGDLTTNLPPSYQITPQILLDVRVGTVR